jgi:aldose 1-epimerase
LEKNLWGKSPKGEEIYTYTIKNSRGMSAKLMNYGANVLSLFVPDKEGVAADVVLGFEKLEDYFVNAPYFGCCVAPCGNRIGDAVFTLNGKTYQLDKNDGVNNLHSGFDPLCKRMWETGDVTDSSITFTYHKKDMDMGFPGNMNITVTYTITEDNEFRIDYSGLSDADTIFNPTNHSYFNLSGHDSGDILDHEVWINATHFTMTDAASIPNGTLLEVKGTPMDFTSPKPMRPEVDDAYEQLAWAKGYDHNFALDTTLGELSLAATLYDPKSQRKMEVYTDLPGMQLYCGNYIQSGEIGKGGFRYEPRYGVCFESQYFPNAINIPSFAQPIAKAGVEARTTTKYKFV